MAGTAGGRARANLKEPASRRLPGLVRRRRLARSGRAVRGFCHCRGRLLAPCHSWPGRRTHWTTARRQRRVMTRDSGSEREPPIGAPVAAAPAAGGDMPSRMFCLVPVAWRDAASSGVGPCVAGQPVGGLGLRAAPAGGQCRRDGDRVRLRARRAEAAGRCPATATGTCTRRLRALCQRTVAGAGRLGAHHDGYRGSGPVRVMGGSRRGDRDPAGDIPSGSRIGRWCRRGSGPGPAHRRRPATLVVRE